MRFEEIINMCNPENVINEIPELEYIIDMGDEVVLLTKKNNICLTKTNYEELVYNIKKEEGSKFIIGYNILVNVTNDNGRYYVTIYGDKSMVVEPSTSRDERVIVSFYVDYLSIFNYPVLYHIISTDKIILATTNKILIRYTGRVISTVEIPTKYFLYRCSCNKELLSTLPGDAKDYISKVSEIPEDLEIDIITEAHGRVEICVLNSKTRTELFRDTIDSFVSMVSKFAFYREHIC